MAGISRWGADLFTANLLGRSRPVLDTFYLALIVGNAPTAYVSGEQLAEPPDGSGYVRGVIPNDADTWALGDHSVASNAVALLYPAATTAWGRVRYWALCNAPVGGYVVAFGALSPLLVDTGDVVRINVGALQLQLIPGS